jgi:hypothetical protein
MLFHQMRDCAEVVYDFQDGVREPFGRHIPPVIGLEGEQHLESPPSA